MNLEQLQENKMARLQRNLREVFGSDFNFSLSESKLTAIKQATDDRIKSLKESGVSVDNKVYQKLLLIKEGLTAVDPIVETEELMEADLDQAEVLLAAKQMADDLQKMAENLASMQVEELMSIHNAMKEQVGTAEADAFNQSAEAALGAALDAVKQANEDLSNAVLVAQGEAPATDMGMDGMDMEEPAADMDVDDMGDAEMEPPADDFAGADAADMDTGVTGREMKEDAYLSAMRMVKEAQSEGKVSASVLKQAFAQLKK